MRTLLKYEFKREKIYLYIYLIAIAAIYMTDTLASRKNENFEIKFLASLILPLAIIMIEITLFNNELTLEKEQLIYHTPNSVFNILGTKLIRIICTILIISVVINILNVITDYTPFMPFIGEEEGRYQDYKNVFRIFSVFWTVSIVLAVISAAQFEIGVHTAFFHKSSVSWMYMIIGSIIVLYAYIGLLRIFMIGLPLKVVMNEDVYIYFGKIVDSAMGHSSVFSTNIENDIAAVFYRSDNYIILGITPIIFNFVFSAIMYPINAFIIKKKVFS